MESFKPAGDMPANDSEKLSEAAAKQDKQASSFVEGIGQLATEIAGSRRTKQVLDQRIDELKSKPEKAILCSLLLQASMALSTKIQAMEDINRHSDLSVQSINLEDIDLDDDGADNIEKITMYENVPKSEVGKEFFEALEKKQDDAEAELDNVISEITQGYPEEIVMLEALLQKKSFDN